MKDGMGTPRRCSANVESRSEVEGSEVGAAPSELERPLLLEHFWRVRQRYTWTLPSRLCSAALSCYPTLLIVMAHVT